VSAASEFEHVPNTHDPGEFAALYQDHGRPILRYLKATLRDDAGAEDALHEVFLKAWRSLPSDTSQPALRAWLFTVARTTAIDQARLRSRQDPMAPQKLVTLADRRSRAPLASSGHWISEPEVHDVLRRLPQRHQEILVLRYLMGCTHAETARVLDCTELAVRKAHQRILAVLAAALSSSDLADRVANRARTQYGMRAFRLPRRIALGGFSLLPRSPRRRARSMGR
jgi:RNA polymerase sigma-70 factor, ECF subfamily